MRKLQILILLLLSLAASAQEHSIKIIAKGLPQREIYLADFYGDKNTKIDSVMPDTTGTFVFKIHEGLPSGMYRAIIDKNSFLDFASVDSFWCNPIQNFFWIFITDM